MLSRQTLERYRRMTPGERLELALAMSEDAARLLLEGPPEIVRRRLELLRLQNDERNRRMLAGFARSREGVR